MHARPVLLQEERDAGLARDRGDQLDVRVADLEQHGVDALLLHGLAMLLAHAEAVRIEGGGRVDVLDRDSDVINGAEHGAGY